MIGVFNVEEQGFVNRPKIEDSNLKQYYSDLSLVLMKNSRYYRLIIAGENVAVLGLGNCLF